MSCVTSCVPMRAPSMLTWLIGLSHTWPSRQPWLTVLYRRWRLKHWTKLNNWPASAIRQAWRANLSASGLLKITLWRDVRNGKKRVPSWWATWFRSKRWSCVCWTAATRSWPIWAIWRAISTSTTAWVTTTTAAQRMTWCWKSRRRRWKYRTSIWRVTRICWSNAIPTRRCVTVPGRSRWTVARNCLSVCWIPCAGTLRITAASRCWRWVLRAGCAMSAA